MQEFPNTKIGRRTVLAALGAAGARLVSHPMLSLDAKQSSVDSRAQLLETFSGKSRDRLLRELNRPGFDGQIPAATVEEVAESEGRTVGAVMTLLLPLAQTYSRPPISHYRVGAVVRGSSGSLYLGANFEAPGQALGFSVHAEQAALSNAYMHSEPAVSAIAITAAPCGHCRQFMMDLSPGGEIQVLAGSQAPVTLATLLPMAFGPKDLGFQHGAFPVQETDLMAPEHASDELILAALAAARRSYAPYSKAHSGVALAGKQGRVYKGAYIENAAFNPSLPPLETALIALTLGGESSSDIARAVLVETEGAAISQVPITQTVLGAVAPAVRLQVVTVNARA